MTGVSETAFFVWFGALTAPLLVYGIWMRIKLMRTTEGEAFLVDREIAGISTERANRRLGGESAETAGKVAKLGVGVGALTGAYGDEVSLIARQSFVFFKGYALYALVVIAIGYFFVF